MATPNQAGITLMDEIFAMIMKEAESREGKDLLKNIYSVFIEIGTWVMRTMAYIQNRESDLSNQVQVDAIKSTRLKFRRKHP